MKHTRISWDNLGVSVELASFHAGQVTERHVMLHVEARGELFQGQWDRLTKAELRLYREMPEASVVMKRYFLSDATNQVPLMQQNCDSQDKAQGAVSYIQQPPLDGSKVAVWLYMTEGMEVATDKSCCRAEHNGYQHLWTMGMNTPTGDSAQQTTVLLRQYEEYLSKQKATLLDNCIRTWFFVRDVDTQYHGMVVARRENFIAEGLTPDTHYIASTGIQGLPADTHALIQLGAYALTGHNPQQVEYVKALTHLNPTIEYGVTFERGTVVRYGDRSHCFISGTASINNRGEVLHIGDIRQQTLRMWENVEKLLEEGRFCTADLAQIIVYLRDIADYDTVRTMFLEKFPQVPTVFTLAPVCRPEWLIEMECMAIREEQNDKFRKF